MALPDAPPRSVGFISSRVEGRDEKIQVCANEVQSRPEPAEQTGRTRTEAFRVVRKLLTTAWRRLIFSSGAARLFLIGPCVRDITHRF